MRDRRFLCALGALIAAGASLALAADPVAPPAAADPVAACSCHDSLRHANGSPVSKKLVAVRAWAKDGPHVKLGCTACHPGMNAVPHKASHSARVECGTCHAERAKVWKQTVHGVLDGKDPRINGCQTCHAEHPVFAYDDPRGRYTNGRGLLHSCSACHQPMPLSTELELPLNPSPEGSTWPSSLHGLIQTGDRRAVAACASCHGAHELYPASDPRSPIHPARLAATCGACHNGVQPGLIHGKTRPTTTGVARKLTNYFDIWYLWSSGAVVFTVLGVFGALGIAALARRGTRPETTRPRRDR